jgi:hypothetical protein
MKMLSRTLIGALVLGAAWSFTSPSSADDRLPLPSKEEIKKAEALIGDLFRKDYMKTSAIARAALVEKLLEQAKETKDDPVARYVLLREARDISARLGDAATAMQVAEEIANNYQVGAGAARAAVADTLARVATSSSAGSVAEALISAAGAARAGDDSEGEIKLLQAAETAAKKSRNVALVAAATKRLKGAAAYKAESEKVKPFLDTLKDKPDDPEANAAVGRFRCLFKGEWEGVENLLKGNDEALKAAAEKDKAATDGADAEQVIAGDTWYDLAAKADADVKLAMQARAKHWYGTALENLSGLTKTKVEKRIAELTPKDDLRTAGGGESGIGGRVVHWTSIRKAIKESNVKEWNIVGGGFFKTPFKEVPADGGILIGFYYTTTGGGKYPGAVLPIWLTAAGEVKGKAYGMGDPGEPVRVVKAKPGYAVGALYTRGGGGFDAFKPIFMKIKDGGLDTNDKYEGTYVGGNGGGEGTLGGDGNFIVGIHGKVHDDPKKFNQMGCLSIISLTVKAGPP